MKHINVLLRHVNLNHSIEGPWAGVDAGAYSLIEQHKKVSYAYGDFDSVNEDEINEISNVVDIDIVPREKDFTDSEIALFDLVDKGYNKIDVYGALGGRIDHELINIQLLNHPKLQGKLITLCDDKNVIRLFVKGQHAIESVRHKYVSFIPLYDETLITLEGFKYDIKDRYINIGQTLTVSNELLGNTGKLTTNKNILMINSTD